MRQGPRSGRSATAAGLSPAGARRPQKARRRVYAASLLPWGALPLLWAFAPTAKPPRALARAPALHPRARLRPGLCPRHAVPQRGEGRMPGSSLSEFADDLDAPFYLLGLDDYKASQEEVRAAFRRLARTEHP